MFANPEIELNTISKTLTWLLRHAAQKEGLTINSGGFIKINDILRHPKLINKCSLTDILCIVDQDQKQRFTSKQDDKDEWLIRANQGHTIQVDQLELQPILLSASIEIEYPQVVHGTYYNNWKSIKLNGLHHRNRNHIHFASGLPEDNGVISGMRRSCQLHIFIDLKQALEDKLTFFKSANGVILSPGNQDGYITPTYFLQVLDAKTKRPVC